MSQSTDKGGRGKVRVGRYEVVDSVTTGGRGAAYPGLGTDSHRPGALKILSPELATNQNMVDRFRREARSAAKLRHENIVAIYEVGEANGSHFIAMEFVEGTDLAEHIARHKKLDAEESRQILIQAAHALDHAHKEGIVHRDIKPSNFLLQRKNGRLCVKLTDFGLARQARDEDFRLTKAGTTVGTVDYMSPEQARNSNSADIRSDIYSLGCTLYHMLAGRPPFPDGGLTERLFQHVEQKPPDIHDFNADVPNDLVAVLAKMLAKKPADRYQTPAALLDDLEHPEKIAPPSRAADTPPEVEIP